MMPASTIFLIGVFIAVMVSIFAYETIHEIRKAGRQSSRGNIGPMKSAPNSAREQMPSAAHPMRILVATDGSPCSDIAVRSIAERPWPPDTEVQVITVVHTRVPYVPEPIVGAATYLTALREDRDRAPERLRAAERSLASIPNLAVRSTVLEGDPEKAIVEEADRWKADLVVVGSHGYGPVKHLILGSVSQGVAAHAPCSVEIVRCRHDEA